VAGEAGADAVHPGYGFLSENAAFAHAVDAAGLAFIGPPAAAIAAMGDKVEARRIAVQAGVGPVPGTSGPVDSVEGALAAAHEIGFPVALKASGGGGGRGFRVARTEAEVADAYEGASGEAQRYFGNPAVYLERYLERPRHIEVQVMADGHGNVIALGERDCSIQRRHQKLVEESPSPAVDAALRERLAEATERLARAVGYTSAGTVEYLLDVAGEFHFLEMNTRIQVEHTVTEMVTGIDLVREQIQVARGEPLSFRRDGIAARGWAIECRINAEDAGRDFAPVPGTIGHYRAPAGFGVRVDGALEAGDAIQPRYDSLIAKLVTWGRTRAEAIDRMARALGDFDVAGVPTTIPFHRRVMEHPAFRSGDVSTSFLADYPELVQLPSVEAPAVPMDDNGPAREAIALLVEVNGRRFETVVHGLPHAAQAGTNSRSARPGRSRSTDRGSEPGGNDLISPIHGTVIRLAVATGDVVEAGQVVCVVEAMKMENELNAHKSGTVSALPLQVGATVSIGQAVATIES
jgi:acetyl-CoA/propionyl-CoA carboxylase biotin carboxyl carrier protein